MIFWPQPLRSPPEPDLGLDFPPAGAHYRALVSVPSQYDVLGAIQFEFMFRLGLREHHTLLDIGCGSLRGGRLFIPYLLPGRYFGIEPAVWPIETGVDRELGAAVLDAKAPAFLIDSEFTCSGFGRAFDFLLAHSIFAHASSRQISRCLAEARLCMDDKSIFAATYVPGADDYTGEEWKAPGSVTYTRERMLSLAQEQGLHCIEYELHPFGQQWVLFTAKASVIKPRVNAVAFQPAGAARVGQSIEVIVMAEAFGEDLKSIQLVVNTAPDTSTSAPWDIVATQLVDESAATVSFRWDTTGLQAGRHRVGVNLSCASGNPLWWYEQPPHTYLLL